MLMLHNPYEDTMVTRWTRRMLYRRKERVVGKPIRVVLPRYKVSIYPSLF